VVAKRDAVMDVISKRKRVKQTCRELGISEITFARWREQVLEGMEAALLDKDKCGAREDVGHVPLSGGDRPHSSLGYRTPNEFALDWNNNNPGLAKTLVH